jgi:8-oxo-dGTP pyrophosphatase MutT (NUDIX family)
MSEIPDGFELPEKEAPHIRPSASLVATRDGADGIEILFCHRVPQMPSFPDFWAFPGGGVTHFDRAAAEALPGFSNDDKGAGLACLMREMVEEVGWAPASNKIIEVNPEIRAKVVIDGKNWHPLAKVGSLPSDSSRFNLITIRTTPPLSPMRFATTLHHLNPLYLMEEVSLMK